MNIDKRYLSKNLAELETKLKDLAENPFDKDGIGMLPEQLKYPRVAVDLTGQNIPTYSIDNSARSSQSIPTLERGSFSQLLSERNSIGTRDSWSFSDSERNSINMRDSWSFSDSERNSTSVGVGVGVGMRKWSFSESIPESHPKTLD